MPIDLDDDTSSVQSQDTDKCKKDILLLLEFIYLIQLFPISVPETPTPGSKLSKGSSKESTPIPEVPEESTASESCGVSVAANRKRLAEDAKEREDERKPVSGLLN